MGWDHKQSIKEIIRHYGLGLGLGPALNRLRSYQGHKTSHLREATRSGRFAEIYSSGAWVHSDDQSSFSGVGSEETATAHLADELVAILPKLDCDTLVDIGCGDWSWMRNVRLPCNYVGIDFVPDVSTSNHRFAGLAVRFELLDAVVDPLPKADVALCREVLFHLSFKDAMALLTNIRASCRWLIATTDEAIWFNSDISTGDFRRINLRRGPFLLPEPHYRIADEAISCGRVLGVWRCNELLLGTDGARAGLPSKPLQSRGA